MSVLGSEQDAKANIRLVALPGSRGSWFIWLGYDPVKRLQASLIKSPGTSALIPAEKESPMANQFVISLSGAGGTYFGISGSELESTSEGLDEARLSLIRQARKILIGIIVLAHRAAFSCSARGVISLNDYRT